MFKIAVLTEAGTGIGYGHLFRCQAIAEAISRDVRYYINGDCGCLQVKKSESVDWTSPEINRLNRLGSVDLIIIDSYLAESLVYERIFESSNALLLMLDDYGRINYPPGIVLNPSIGASATMYRSDSDHLFLAGPQYTILRKPFLVRHLFNTADKITSIFVTMGGSGLAGLTSIVVNTLYELDHTLNFLIVGSVASTQFVQGARVKVFNNLSAQEIKNLMYGCDIAVAAGGQTLNELGSIGVPTLVVKVAENQNINIQGWVLSGGMTYLGDSVSDVQINLIKEYNELLSVSLRRERTRILRDSIDLLGVKRIKEAVLGALNDHTNK